MATKAARVSKAFQTALARPVLNRLATIPIFQQGQELFLHHQLKGLIVESDEAAAHVQDGQPFLARLWMEDGFLQYECPCERGQQGFLCCHGVAVALASLESTSTPGKAKAKAKTIDLANTDKILREQSSDTLAGLLLNWAQQDERLMQHLMSFAAQQGGFALDLKAYRTLLKKRLKKPRMRDTAADYKKLAKAIETELAQIAALADQGQGYAALTLAADVVLFLFTFHTWDSAGAHWVVNLVPVALQHFAQAAHRSRADAAVLIPHILAFYRHDLGSELESSSGQFDLLALLDKSGQLALARAAEALVEPAGPNWRDRAPTLRLMKLAQDLYLAAKDFDSMERVVTRFQSEGFLEPLELARLFLNHSQPQRTLDYLLRVQQSSKKTLPREFVWLAAEAHLQLKNPAAALTAVLPAMEQHDPSDFANLHKFATNHDCWPQWRKLLLDENPQDDPQRLHRHHWRFQLHMLEENYAAAWPIAIHYRMNPALACRCASEMRLQDPTNAARVIGESAEHLLSDTRTLTRALVYLNLAAQLVIDQGIRPTALANALRATQRRFGIHGHLHILKSHEFVWNKAIALLESK